MKRSGVADLPLHGGRVPPGLATRMVSLGTAITESVVYHHGGSALLDGDSLVRTTRLVRSIFTLLA